MIIGYAGLTPYVLVYTSMLKLFVPNKKNQFKPYLLRKSALTVYTLMLLLINMFGGLVGIPEAMASSITPDNIIKLTNEERSGYGLNQLSSNAKLMAAAQAKANNMFKEQYWDHFGPNGESPWMFITQAGYEYVYAGENLAKGFRSAEGVHEAWMASPTHKENIVSPNYKDIGVAVVSGVLLGKETTLVVQMFGNLTDEVNTPISVKSETTNPSVRESGQIKSISITSPKNNSLLNDPNVDIKGETENISGSYTVEILDEADIVGETQTDQSSWTYDHKIDWTEGPHKFTAQVKGQNTKSDELIVTIDSTPPQVDKKSVSVKHVGVGYELSFLIDGDCEEVNLVTGDQTYSIDKNEEGSSTLTLSKDSVGEKTVLMLTDKAGNTSQLDISEYFSEGESDTATSNIISWFKNTIGTTDGISILIISFVFILLSIEVYVYWKKGKLGKHAGELFTLGAWCLIIVVGMFNGFGGIIT